MDLKDLEIFFHVIIGSDDNIPNEYCEENDDDSVKDPNYETNDETSSASS